MIQACRGLRQRYHPGPVEPDLTTPPRPQEGGKSGTAFALVLALLLPAGLFAQLASPLAGLYWTEPFVFLLPAVIATAGSNLEPRAWLRLRPARLGALAGAAGVGLAGWFLGGAIFAAVRAVAPASLVARYDLSRLFEGPAAEQAAFAIAASVIAPLCEELAFRGHLASAFHSRHRPAVAIGATALVFAVMHLDPLRGPSLVVLGALYGWLAWRTGSIWPSVVAHAVNNGIASVLALTLGGAEAPGEEPTLEAALVGAVIGGVAVAAAVAVFRHLVPSTPDQDGLPLANPADPSARFRSSRVPTPLLVAAAAAAASLAAILLGGLRVR
jgi:membrane protease YdiL (CAAX protease family)